MKQRIIILLLLVVIVGITFLLKAQAEQGQMLNNLTNQIEQQDKKIDNLKKQIELIETSTAYPDSNFKSYMSF